MMTIAAKGSEITRTVMLERDILPKSIVEFYHTDRRIQYYSWTDRC